jgi:RNA polymerase sigma-70 factor (sigma-E family)
LGASGAEGANEFEELARVARPRFVYVAQGITGDRADAEDAVQTSFVKAMGAWPRMAGQERWRQQAYVREIVVNTCRSNWRKWGSRVHGGDLPELAHQPSTDAVEDRELVRQALALLPARQRAVLVLRYYEDLSEVEIAKRLGCPPGTVKSSAARALRTLRDLLAECEGPDAGDQRFVAPAPAAPKLAVVPATPEVAAPLALSVKVQTPDEDEPYEVVVPSEADQAQAS